MKKVGITGAAGNIGSTLRQGLGSLYELTLYDIKEISNQPARFVKVDFADAHALAGIFDGLDCLIHLAGNPNPGAPAQSTMRNNFQATSLVFQAAREAGVAKIVFASSNFYHEGSIRDFLQGQSKELITLDTPPTPISLYGQSKVYGENIGRHLSYLGTRFVALRIGWTVPEDNPAAYGGAYMRAVFCSKRDLTEAFRCAVETDADFLTAFAVSDNGRPVFDLAQTRQRLGFKPRDNAEDYV